MKRMIAWIITGVLFLGLLNGLWTGEQPAGIQYVEAQEYEYPLDKIPSIVELDENQKDEQGVYYTLKDNHTAIVGDDSTGYMNNTCQYEGANGGICILPEKVSYNGEEYVLTEISSYAFYNNRKLTTLVMPDTVTNINFSAFCESTLQCIYIGSMVSNIDTTAFMSCYGLREIKVSEKNPYYVDLDGVLYSSDMTSLYCNPPLRKGSSLATYEIPNGVERIEEYAFDECQYRRITIPSTCTHIEAHAFDKAKNLVELDLSNVKRVGQYAFSSCNSLRYLNLPDGDCFFEQGSFEEADLLESLYLKKGVNINEIGYAFSDCDVLRTVVVEEGVTRIARQVFAFCPLLETVILPDTVTTLEYQCFAGCSNLSKLYIPPSVDVIGANAVTGNTTIYGEKGSTAESFALENDLSFVDVRKHNHKHLPEVTLYDGRYEKISARYCSNCGFGTEIQREKKDGSIIIDGTKGEYDFSLEQTKQEMYLDESQMDQQGLIYSLDSYAMVEKMDDGAGKSHVVIPELVVDNEGERHIVKKIWTDAFYGNECVVSIAIPDTVEYIGENALASPTLQYLYIGESVKHIDEYAFGTCKNIKGIWVAPWNRYFYVKDNTLYDKTGKVVYDFSAKMEILPTTEEKNTEDKPIRTEKPTDTNKKPGTVKGIQATSKNGKHVTLHWKKVSKCNGYEIYRANKKTGKYKCIGTVAAGKTSYVDKKVKYYNTYSYKIRAFVKSKDKKTPGKYSKAKAITITGLKTPNIRIKKKKTASGTRYLELNLSNINGTYIELSVKKKGGKYKKVKLVSNRLSYYKGKLKIGYKPGISQMWIRVRTYKKVKGKKYYSEYSKSVLVKP